MRSMLSIVGLFFVISATLGCATLRGASARHQYIEGQAKEYVYAKSAGDVWPAARQLLFEKGYEVKNTGEGGTLTAESEWKYEGKKRTRYLVQVTKVDDGHCKVMFTKMETEKDMSPTSERDVGSEWDLIQKIEPERAAEIKAEADKRAEAAKAAN
jgi:hypothetical protein